MMTFFDVPTGKNSFVSGPDPNTEWNCVVQEDSLADGTVEVIAYDLTGNPIAAVEGVVKANQPNVLGPVPFFGSVAEMKVASSCTLGFVNKTAGTVRVTIHGSTV